MAPTPSAPQERHARTQTQRQTPRRTSPSLPATAPALRTFPGQLRETADANLSELEFTFARDLRAAFAEQGIKLAGPPTELIAELFVIKPDLRKKQVQISFSRQSVTKGAIKLDVERVVTAYQRARKEICERKVDDDELLGELFEAYQRVLKLQVKQMGWRAGIVDCYRELVLVRQPLGFRKTPAKSSFVDYPKTHFAYDMLQSVEPYGVLVTATRAMFLATGATEGQFIKDLYFAAEK